MEKSEVFSQKTKLSEVTVSSGSKFIGATFLYLALALVITFATSSILALLIHISPATIDDIAILFIVALVAYIPVMLWVNFSCIANGKTLGPAFFTYSIVMGLLISPLVLVVDFASVAIAIGVTALAFGVMSLIAFNTKKELTTLGIFAYGLLSGLFILMIVNLIVYFIIGFEPFYLTLSIGFFVVILLLTVCDLKHVKRIAVNGGASKNVALMCALNLYVDFIYIFIRLLIIVASLRNRN